MKSAAQTKKKPTAKATAKASPKASRSPLPARPARKAPAPVAPMEAPRPVPAAANGGVAMPDLSAVGVDGHVAETHVAQCEDCGRAHRHVVKNPKDVMARESFGHKIAACLAGKHAASA